MQQCCNFQTKPSGLGSLGLTWLVFQLVHFYFTANGGWDNVLQNTDTLQGGEECCLSNLILCLIKFSWDTQLLMDTWNISVAINRFQPREKAWKYVGREVENGPYELKVSEHGSVISCKPGFTGKLVNSLGVYVMLCSHLNFFITYWWLQLFWITSYCLKWHKRSTTKCVLAQNSPSLWRWLITFAQIEYNMQYNAIQSMNLAHFRVLNKKWSRPPTVFIIQTYKPFWITILKSLCYEPEDWILFCPSQLTQISQVL